MEYLGSRLGCHLTDVSVWTSVKDKFQKKSIQTQHDGYCTRHKNCLYKTLVRMIGAQTQTGFVRGVDIRENEVVTFRAKGKRHIQVDNFFKLKNDEQIKTEFSIILKPVYKADVSAS